MLAAMYCTSGFAPCETESASKSNPQQNPESFLDWALRISDEHLSTMRLSELCALWREGRL
jgi:hypothetical protein